ncbi:hypothetical protein BJ165DRAFT_1479278 [Panaeolus papilionaceus]|nr:hypothetical protein BJ165DRAFT_1479278 [Panaeolus papilionaceus]
MPPFINHITIDNAPRWTGSPPAPIRVVTSPVVGRVDESGTGDNVRLISGASGLESCIPPPPSSLPTIFATKLVDLSEDQVSEPAIPAKPPQEEAPRAVGLEMESWTSLHDSARKCVRTLTEPQITSRDHSISALISQWNENHFRARNGQIRLCEEKCQPLGAAVAEGDDEDNSKNFALYHFSTAEHLPYDATRYEVRDVSNSMLRVRDRIQRVDVLGPFGPTSEGEAGVWRRLSLSVVRPTIPMDSRVTGAPAITSDANIIDGFRGRELGLEYRL